MPRIAYLTGTFPSWSETFIAQELELLLAAPDLAIAPIAIWQGEGETGGMRMHYLYPRGKGGRGAKGGVGGDTGGPLAFSPPVARRISLVRHGAALRGLIDYCRAEHITHLHAAFADLPGLLAAVAAERLGITYSVSAHAVDVVRVKYGDRAIFGDARFVTLCNQRARAVLLERSPELADKVHVVPHGVRIENWPWRRTPYQATKPFRLLVVGRLVRKKRVDLAIAGLRRLRDKHVAASLCVLGDGPEREALEASAQDLPVKWVGHVPRKLVREAMAESDALLVTSEERPGEDMEGLPNVIVEAMASGLPVIAHPSGSMLDILDASTCLMVNAEKASEIERAVRLLLQQPESIHEGLRLARRRVVEEYDAAALIRRRIDLLRAHI